MTLDKPGSAVGVDVLIAALAKALGPDAALPILAEAGIRDTSFVFETLPDATPEEAETLPSLRPDEHLSSLLKVDLKPFRQGEMDAAKALRLLLASRDCSAESLKVIGCVGAAHVSREQRGLYDTCFLIRGLASDYQSRFVLGARYHAHRSDTMHSEFVRGKNDEGFAKEYPQLLHDEAATWTEHFGSLAYTCSPLGEIRRMHGRLEAHIMGAVLLAEMGYVGMGPLCVRELGYIIEPKQYHRAIGEIRSAVKALHVNGLVDILPCLEGQVWLGTQVLPSDEALDSWLTFLHRNGLVGEDEIEDATQETL